MGDGALDEGFLAHPARRIDRVEPELVRAPPVAQRAAREQTDVAADGGQVRSALERGELLPKPRAVHEVVGIHARDERRAAAIEPDIQRLDQSPVGRRDDPEAGVPLREGTGAGERAVRGAVVDDDALPARLELPLDAPQAGPDGRFRIEGRQQDRDERLRLSPPRRVQTALADDVLQDLRRAGADDHAEREHASQARVRRRSVTAPPHIARRGGWATVALGTADATLFADEPVFP